MQNKNKSEKVCRLCGRIITDPNNKTGFCPKCQKIGKEATFSVAGLVVGIGLLAKNNRDIIIKVVHNVVKNIKKL